MLVGQCPLKSLSSVCPSLRLLSVSLPICLSVCPPVANFSQDWIFSFFWSLVVLVTRIWAKGSKSGPKLGFCFFQKFGSLVFLEIPHNNSLQVEGEKEGEDEARLHDSLEEFLTISRGKTHKKVWGPKFVSNRPRSGLKLGFFFFFQVWFDISSSFSLHYIGS